MRIEHLTILLDTRSRILGGLQTRNSQQIENKYSLGSHVNMYILLQALLSRVLTTCEQDQTVIYKIAIFTFYSSAANIYVTEPLDFLQLLYFSQRRGFNFHPCIESIDITVLFAHAKYFSYRYNIEPLGKWPVQQPTLALCFNILQPIHLKFQI